MDYPDYVELPFTDADEVSELIDENELAVMSREYYRLGSVKMGLSSTWFKSTTGPRS